MFEEYQEYLSVADCCEILGVGNHTIYSLINEGKLEARRVGDKMWRIPKASLAVFV
ncbi:MAG: helix-turn-helix domain-containing protein, partial [Eubacterium sp.]|nr:helix-turn-helix domain-containing protein [Eubacterium sp.]